MTGQVLDSERRRSAVRLPALQSPVLLETAAALPHARGLSPARSTTAAPPRPRPIDGRCTQPHPRAGRAGSGQTRDGSRVHYDSFVEVGARLCPCGIAASTPQSFLAASLAARTHRLGSSPPTHSTGAHRSRPRSTRFEPVPNQGGVTRRFLAYSSPSRLPDPHHLAVLARPGVVRAAPTLPGTTRIRLPSAPPSRCDGISGEGLSPPLEPLHLTAHLRPAPYVRCQRPSGCPGGRPGDSPARGHQNSRLMACGVPGVGVSSGGSLLGRRGPRRGGGSRPW
jgi:hypothetical protein